MNEITRQIRQLKWAEIIRECNFSGIPKEQWMAAHGINSKSFYRYQKALREQFGREYLCARRIEQQSNDRDYPECSNTAVALPLKSTPDLPETKSIEAVSAVITVGRLTSDCKYHFTQITEIHRGVFEKS